MTCVIDASAVLAILFDERGADAATALPRDAFMSAVNLTEILEKFAAVRDGVDATAAIRNLQIHVIPCDMQHAKIAAELKPGFVGKDISLADRACMALALQRRLPVVTADTAWAKPDVALDTRMIR